VRDVAWSTAEGGPWRVPKDLRFQDLRFQRGNGTKGAGQTNEQQALPGKGMAARARTFMQKDVNHAASLGCGVEKSFLVEGTFY